ncbi:MAG: alpha/beta hydrolase [Nanoarchaeota archaeon]|nr:alpha/beta hydrolase [Nanoarchaeota archaeon]
MKRAFIIHGWDFNPEMHWYPWLRKELEKKGFEVIVPEMPNTSEPEIDEWVSHLRKVVGKLDSETYFIGHSIGCQTIMRYLAGEDYEGKIGNVVFVAGWFNLDNLEGEEVEEIAKPWLETSIDFKKVKRKLSGITVFLSSNDPYNCLEENKKMFKDKLGAKVIVLEDKGHFTMDEGVINIPEILRLI